jgi:nitronate monooxygenase
MLIVGAGLPLDLPEYTANYPDVALVPIISGVPAARTICQQWEREYNRFPDAFIVGCPRTSGGHVGIKNFTAGDLACSLEWLIPDLAEYLQSEFGLSIPIIGSGGVWNRADIDTMLEFGASGVQIGTRFILTDECDADPRYKEFHLHASPEDVVIVPSPVGVPGRALRNDFTEKAIAQSCHPAQRCIANCLNVCEYRDRKETYCLIQALNRAARGDVETGLVFSGARTDVPERILPVADLVAELTSTTNLSNFIPVFS